MKLDYSTYRLLNSTIAETDNELQLVLTAGDLTFLCTLIFDTDEVSSTYQHWICSMEVVSDTEDIPERSFVIYPNTLHFEGDVLYTVAISSNLEEIGHDDLTNTFITIGVPADE